MSQRYLPGRVGFQGGIITGFKDRLTRAEVDAGLENIVNRKTQPTKLFELICARPMSKLLSSFSRTFATLTASASVRGCCFNWALPLILILYGPFADSWPTMYAIVNGETSGAHLCASPQLHQRQAQQWHCHNKQGRPAQEPGVLDVYSFTFHRVIVISTTFVYDKG